MWCTQRGVWRTVWVQVCNWAVQEVDILSSWSGIGENGQCPRAN